MLNEFPHGIPAILHYYGQTFSYSRQVSVHGKTIHSIGRYVVSDSHDR